MSSKTDVMRKLKKFFRKIRGKTNNEMVPLSNSQQTYLVRINDQSRDKWKASTSNESTIFDPAADYKNNDTKIDLVEHKSSIAVTERKYVSQRRPFSRSVHYHGDATRRVVNKKSIQHIGYECSSNNAHSTSDKMYNGRFSWSNKLHSISATSGQRFAPKKEDGLNEWQTIKNIGTACNANCFRPALSGRSKFKSSAPFAKNWDLGDASGAPVRRKPRTYVVNNKESQNECEYSPKMSRAMCNRTSEDAEVLKERMSVLGEMIPIRDSEHLGTKPQVIDDRANDLRKEEKEEGSVVRILNDDALLKENCSESDGRVGDSSFPRSQRRDDCPGVLKHIHDISYYETFKYSNFVTLQSLTDSRTLDKV
ncbi:hypothetical protein KM043_015314 [Ampulex compressa]|nr:hypothetical protein KM043_015314 [Ampulex compressa]